jgi:radical SAM protein with 4Fe4S-binding SPASM domain
MKNISAKKYQPIEKSRREFFGGVIFRERPAFVAHINKEYADEYQIPETEGAILQDGIFSAPLDAHIAITTRCNMFCKGCYNTREGDEPKDISLDKAKTVIEKLSELGVFSLSFGGGEPTLHPEVFEIAAYAREKQILPNMTTNGLTMTEDFAKACSVFGNVHFSIHKPQDMSHVFSAMRVYRKATGNKPGLNLLITTETLPCLDVILFNARKSGVKVVLFLRYKTTIKNADTQELCLDNRLAELPERFKQLQQANKRLMFLYDCSLFEVLAENNFADTSTYYKYDNNGCLGGNAYIAIDVNGMYKPCSFWHEPFGNVSDITFENWIHSSELNEFRTMIRNEFCTRCEYIKLCVGGCRLLHDKIRNEIIVNSEK